MQTHYGWMIGTVVLVASAVAAHGGPPASVGTVSGKVTYTGTPPKMKPIDMAKEPNCAKEHAAAPVLTENVVTGPGNSLRWVVVYISAGDQGSTPGTETVRLDQKACQYIRSEERRVGKEWRARWMREQDRKEKQTRD